MRTVRVSGARITDSRSFHREWATAFGFPKFYGDNMDAWIDCMSSLTEGHPLAEIRIVSDETLCVEISNFEKLVEMAPSVASELVACTAFVNRRYAEAGESARIALVPLGSET